MNTDLKYWCRKVEEMQPGQRMQVDKRELMDIPTFEHNGASFRPWDRVLGNIVGSAWTHSVTEAPDGKSVIFERYAETGKRHYTDPDHRVSP